MRRPGLELFAVQGADRQDRQRMHRFVHAQTFDVGPLEDRCAHLVLLSDLGVISRLRIFSREVVLDTLQEISEPETDRWDNHRPGFDGTHP